jgi:hypothetical protein
MTAAPAFTDHARGRAARAQGVDLRFNPFCRESQLDRYAAWQAGWIGFAVPA